MNFRSAGFLAHHGPRGASTCKKSNRYFFFAPHALACRRKVQRDLKIAVPLCTAVLQVPSKSYENRPKRSAFVHFSRNGGN